jgi:hypothetical protein
MRTKFIGYCVTAVTLCIGSATDGLGGGGTFTRGCAARDMQIMMMIESSVVSAQAKDDALRTIMHARIMCFEGHVMDALALYDNIAHGVTSGWQLSGQ